jgi:hypothetical protein
MHDTAPSYISPKSNGLKASHNSLNSAIPKLPHPLDQSLQDDIKQVNNP